MYDAYDTYEMTEFLPRVIVAETNFPTNFLNPRPRSWIDRADWLTSDAIPSEMLC